MTLILHTQLESLYRYDVSPITIRYNDLFPLFRCLMMFNYFLTGVLLGVVIVISVRACVRAFIQRRSFIILQQNFVHNA